MWKSIARIFGGAAVIAALLVSPTTQVAASGESLAAVRDATAQFHDVDRTASAGYGAFLPCFDNPGVGGMGQHYVKPSLINGTVTATTPQALVYEVDGGRLRLVAVEYIVLYSQVSSTATPPRLFGQSFSHNNALQLWALHAWIWRNNPSGMFATWNPEVKLCPGHTSAD